MYKYREFIKNKYGGKCAYTGTDLLPDWEIDHCIPKSMKLQSFHKISNHNDTNNLFPCQKIVNHYKGSLDLETFRNWYLGGLHQRLKNLPKNPKTEKSIKKKAYLLEVARLFNIQPDKPFSGVFYFEMLS